jgi:hypothetical protein
MVLIAELSHKKNVPQELYNLMGTVLATAVNSIGNMWQYYEETGEIPKVEFIKISSDDTQLIH